MNPKLQNELYEKYPWLKPIDGFGITVDNGWYNLLDILCNYIQHGIEFENKCIINYQEELAKGDVSNWSWKPNDKPFEFPITNQIKEKFGGLRFYIRTPNCTRYEFRGAIAMAEMMSFTICERCGNKGKLRNKLAWKKTLCFPCYEQFIKPIISKRFTKLRTKELLEGEN